MMRNSAKGAGSASGAFTGMVIEAVESAKEVASVPVRLNWMMIEAPA